ncbi:hypothetical protein Save01_04596 [Streptomyces avermitilis]
MLEPHLVEVVEQLRTPFPDGVREDDRLSSAGTPGAGRA